MIMRGWVEKKQLLPAELPAGLQRQVLGASRPDADQQEMSQG